MNDYIAYAFMLAGILILMGVIAIAFVIMWQLLVLAPDLFFTTAVIMCGVILSILFIASLELFKYFLNDMLYYRRQKRSSGV